MPPAADNVSGIQNITGTASNDTIFGGTKANVLLGGTGNDYMSGEYCRGDPLHGSHQITGLVQPAFLTRPAGQNQEPGAEWSG